MSSKPKTASRSLLSAVVKGLVALAFVAQTVWPSVALASAAAASPNQPQASSLPKPLAAPAPSAIFEQTVSFGSTGIATRALDVVDLNYDNRLDIASLDVRGPWINYQISANAYEPVDNYSSPDIKEYSSMASGDLDNDSYSDLVVGGYTLDANGRTKHAVIHTYNTYSSPYYWSNSITVPITNSIAKVALADFGGYAYSYSLNKYVVTAKDGYQDIAYTIFNTVTNKAELYVIMRYTDYYNYNTPIKLGDGSIGGIAVGDADHDGDVDIFSGRFYENDGDGTFTNVSSSIFPHGPIELVDLNRDGYLDILYLNTDSSNYSIYISRMYDPANSAHYGTGSFFAFSNAYKGMPESMDIGDINGDGSVDFVFHTPGYVVTYCLSISQYYSGAWSWSATNCFTVDTDLPNAIVHLADMNNDARTDIIVGPRDRMSHIFLNTGGPQLTKAFQFPFDSNLDNTAYSRVPLLGDLNGDGYLDAVYLYQKLLGTIAQSQIYLGNGQGAFSTSPANFGPSGLRIRAAALGDIDNDNDLDIVTVQSNYQQTLGKNVIYLNDGLGNFYNNPSVNNGDVDCANLGSITNVRCFNISGENGSVTDAWSDAKISQAVALGDMDNDGDLDILFKEKYNYGAISLNDGAGRFFNGLLQYESNVRWIMPGYAPASMDDVATAIAVSDLNGDGWLDVALGADSGRYVNPYTYKTEFWDYVYLTNGSPFSFSENRFGYMSQTTADLALGDFDQDGSVDIAVHNQGQPDIIYLNDTRGGFPTFEGIPLDCLNSRVRCIGSGAAGKNGLAVADFDGDGRLDLAFNQDSGAKQGILYINGPGTVFSSENAFKLDAMANYLAAGDLNNDGLGDLLIGSTSTSYLPSAWVSPMRKPVYRPGEMLPEITIQKPVNVPNAGLIHTARMLEGPVIPITFTLTSKHSIPVGTLRAYYSLGGSGKWLPAVPAGGTPTQSLATSPAGVKHVFNWDVYASGFFGQSSEVTFRIEAYPYPPQGWYNYDPLLVPLRYQMMYTSASTPLFGVRGAQVKVQKQTPTGPQPVSGARVYRKAPGESTAQPFAAPNGALYTTNSQGYLAGRGALGIGDTLYALWPVQSNTRYTLYYTNAPVTETMMIGAPVNSAGLQTLTVSDQNPLYVFNLSVSLEWDASQDTEFLSNLQNALKKASLVLYDVSDGQVALGNVSIYNNRQNWLTSDIVVYAQNGIRPRAVMGGMVIASTNDTGVVRRPDGSLVIGATQVITNAYGPGQIRMGPNWDPFGTSLTEVSQDWQRALAHELSHYLLFLPDNYLGVQDHQPIQTDCRGSFMTSTYDDAYSEFLTRDKWTGDCQYTMAEYITGRTDWETIKKYYPAVITPNAPGRKPLAGPIEFPVGVLNISVPGLSSILPPLYYDIRDARGALLEVPRGQGILFKTNNASTTNDDRAVYLGGTVGGGDRIKVRGAVAGDRLCIFGPYDPISKQAMVGCKTVTSSTDRSITVVPVANWRPNIAVQALTDTQVSVRVELPQPETALRVQFYPYYGPPTSPNTTIAPTSVMTSTDGGSTYTVTLALSSAAYEGMVRIWAPNAANHETTTSFFLSPPWGPNQRPIGAGGDRRAWGANNRQLGAPVASGDGAVTIFNWENIFAETGEVTLQAVADLPGLPLWLTPVGSGYRFTAPKKFPRVISFDYLKRDVPAGYDYGLRLYYSPDDGATWTRLPTQLQTEYNRATAMMPDNAVNGQGIYALLATVDMPALVANEWNLFSYPIPETRPITQALASIDGAYTSLLQYKPADKQWRLYDAAVPVQHPEYAVLVNDLSRLDFGQSYWLYATQEITPYLKVPASSMPSASALTPSATPPATLFGPLLDSPDYQPAAGDLVQAYAGSTLCGQTSVVNLNGQLAYKMQVMCGAPGDQLLITTGGHTATSVPWDNTRAFYLPLRVFDSVPLVGVIPNQATPELAPWTRTVSASSQGNPGGPLVYALEGAPSGMSISAAGQLAWTPAEDQGPGVYTVTVAVTDTLNLRGGTTFRISVSEVNAAPQVASPGPQSVAESAPLTATLTGSDPLDIPANQLSYSLVSPRSGMSIDPYTGRFTWTPSESEGPGVYTVTVQAHDNGTPALTAQTSFPIMVAEVNTAPQLAAVDRQSAVQGQLFLYTLSASDADLPTNTLTYSLPQAPAGAAVDPATGQITWTPGVTQTIGDYAVIARVTDSSSDIGLPALSSETSFTITLSSSGVHVTQPADASINEGAQLTVYLNAYSVPASTLTYALVNPEPGMTINTSGRFRWTPTEAQGPGVYLVQVRISNTLGKVAYALFNVTVNEVNAAPLVTTPASQHIAESQPFTLTVTASDANDIPANTLSYSLVTPTAGMSIDPITGRFTWTPSEAQGPGTYNVTVRVADDGNPTASTQATFALTVDEINTPPVLPAVTNRSVLQGNSLAFDAPAADSDLPANTLSYSLTGAPSGATVNSAGHFTWAVPLTQTVGDYPMTLRVADNGSPSLSDVAAFTVTVEGRAPTINYVPNLTVDEGELLTRTITASSPLPAADLIFSLVNPTAGMSITPAGLFSWTPNEAQGPGSYPVTVRVTDPNDLTAQRTFYVNVREVNRAPTLAQPPAQRIPEAQAFSLSISASDGDTPANSLSFSLVSPAAGMGIHPTTGLFTWTPTELQGPGVYTVTVKATDNGSPALSSQVAFVLTVDEVNTAPLPASVTDLTVTQAQRITTTVTASDSDRPANSLSFALASAPVGATIDAVTGRFAWTPNLTQGAGVYSVTVRVTDNGPAFGLPAMYAETSFHITVLPAPPVVTPPAAQTISEGALFSQQVVAASPVPGNLLAYLLPAPVPGMAISTSGLFTWTPNETQGPGVYPVQVRVTDLQGLTASAVFTLTVAEVNLAPAFSPPSDQRLPEGQPFALTVPAADSDLPANSLAYSLLDGRPGMSIDPASGLFTWTPSEADGPGVVTVTLQAMDNGVPPLSAHTVLTLTVDEVNTAPTLSPVPDLPVQQAQPITLTLSAADSDLPADILTFGLVSAPVGAAIDPASGRFTWTPNLTQGAGQYPVTVRVSDDGSPALVAETTFTLTVTYASLRVARPADQLVNEGSPLSLQVQASSDVPGNLLSFSLVLPQPGMAITQDGLFAWTPSEQQGGFAGVYAVYVKVTDLQGLSTSTQFNVTVGEVNAAPHATAPASRSIPEMQPFAVSIPADDSDDAPPNDLAFSLLAPQPGMAIDPASGLFTWTPAEDQGPGVYRVTALVSDDGLPPLTAQAVFTLTVDEVNLPPTITPGAPPAIEQAQPLTITFGAADSDLPGNALSFSLTSAPSGAAIDSLTGVFSWTPNLTHAAGAYPVTVRVTDNGLPARFAETSFTITVDYAQPHLTRPANQLVDEGSLLSLPLEAASAIPGNLLAFQLLNPQPGMAVSSAGLFTWTPAEQQGPGAYSVAAQVTDLQGLTATTTFSVTVNEVNTAPRLPGLAAQRLPEAEPFALEFSAADDDWPANTLTYALLGAQPGMAIDPASGRFTWTPEEQQGPGVVTVTVQVSDDGLPSLSASTILNLTVDEVNLFPSLAPVPDLPVRQASPITLTLSASDPDLPANALTFGLVSAPQGAALDPTSGLFTWTPNLTQGAGRYPVSVRVTDNGPDFGQPALSAEASFVLTVTFAEIEVTQPAAQFIDEGQTLTLQVAASTPVPGNMLMFNLLSAEPGMDISPTGLFAWTPSEQQGPGVYPVYVQITDLRGLSTSTQFNVTVGEVNAAPHVVAPLSRRLPEMQPFSIAVAADDAADQPRNALTYRLLSPAAGMAMDPSSGQFTWTPSEDQGPGVYPVTVEVSDDGQPALSAQAVFTLTVDEVNTAPRLDPIADVAGLQAEAIATRAYAADSDLPANGLRFSLPAAPSGAAIDPISGQFSWTPNLAQGTGLYPVTVRITDNGQPPLYAETTFTVSVASQPPQVEPIASLVAPELQALSIPIHAFSPVPGNALSYALAGPALSAPVLGMSISSGGLFSWTPSELQGPGAYPITVRVSDLQGLSAITTFTVTVEEVNAAPLPIQPLDQRILEERPFSLNVLAGDGLDSPQNAIAFSLVQPEPGMAIDPASGRFTWTPAEDQAPGAYTVTVQVSDDGSPSLSSLTSFAIQVDEVNTPPTLQDPGDQQDIQGEQLAVALAAADGDLPANALAYSLTSAPPGAAVDALTGQFTWTPDLSQGAGQYPITARVTDNGFPALYDETTFTVTVRTVNDLRLNLDLHPATLILGATAAYTLTATNYAIYPASGVVITATLPAGLAFDPDASHAACSASGQAVTCSLPSLAGHSQTRLRLAARVVNPAFDLQPLTVTAGLHAVQGDSDPANNYAFVSAPVERSQIVFTGDPGSSSWVGGVVTSTTPSGLDFLGEFNNQTVDLAFNDLPGHSEVEVSFDLLILRSWDGNERNEPPLAKGLDRYSPLSTPIGPDIWVFEAQGKTLLQTTFSNWEGGRQAYPGQYPFASFPARTGADPDASLGYDYYTVSDMDSVYHLHFRFNDSAPNLLLRFKDLGLQPVFDEAWGLANVQVSLNGGQYYISTSFLPIVHR